MRSKEEFELLVASSLVSELRRLDAHRRRTLAQVLVALMALLWGPWILVRLIVGPFGGRDWKVGLVILVASGLMTAFLAPVVVGWLRRAYDELYQETIVRRLVTFLDGTLTFDVSGLVGREKFIQAKLFDRPLGSAEQYWGSCLVRGTARTGRFEFSEVLACELRRTGGQRGGRSAVPIFSGLFVAFDASAAAGPGGFPLEVGNLESRLRETSGREVRVGRSGAVVYLAIPWRGGFAPSLLKSAVESGVVKEHFDKLKLGLAAVREVDSGVEAALGRGRSGPAPSSSRDGAAAASASRPSGKPELRTAADTPAETPGQGAGLRLPLYCLVGARPVMAFETADHGMSVAGLSWETAELESAVEMTHRILSGYGEVDYLAEEEFVSALAGAVERIRRKRLDAGGTVDPLPQDLPDPPAESVWFYDDKRSLLAKLPCHLGVLVGEEGRSMGLATVHSVAGRILFSLGQRLLWVTVEDMRALTADPLDGRAWLEASIRHWWRLPPEPAAQIRMAFAPGAGLDGALARNWKACRMELREEKAKLRRDGVGHRLFHVRHFSPDRQAMLEVEVDPVGSVRQARLLEGAEGYRLSGGGSPY